MPFIKIFKMLFMTSHDLLEPSSRSGDTRKVTKLGPSSKLGLTGHATKPGLSDKETPTCTGSRKKTIEFHESMSATRKSASDFYVH